MTDETKKEQPEASGAAAGSTAREGDRWQHELVDGWIHRVRDAETGWCYDVPAGSNEVSNMVSGINFLLRRARAGSLVPTRPRMTA